MFEKNYIFYNNKRINELSNPNIKINIHGSENEIFIQDFFGDGILDIKIEGNRNIFKLGKNNRINNTLTIDFHSVEDGTPEECSILIGDGNEFNGNVSIVSSSEPGTVISVGNNNLFANKISLRGAAFHLLFNMQTMEPLNKEEGISIGSQNWICDDVLFLNKAKIGNNCIIGIRSVVNHDFLNYEHSLIAGAPAVIKRKNVMWDRSLKHFYKKELSSYKKTKTNTIPVFLIAADDIVAPMAVTIASILANTDSFIEFYVLEKSTLRISDKNKERILRLKENFDNFSIEYIPINPSDYSDLTPTTSTYIPNDTYFRYVIPEIKPLIKKAIYLDVDVIVKCDIKNLFDEPLNDCCLGAVNHPKYCWNYPYNIKVMDNLKLKNRDVYINGGVLLFDCEKCRKNQITKKLFETTRELKDSLIWADQDVFNLVFQDTLQLLPEKYNALRSVYENEKITDKNIIDNIAIIHFNGAEKPWTSTPLFNEEFWKYAKLTDFQSDLFMKLDDCLRERVYGMEKHISFLLKKINEYTVNGCKGLQDKHIPFILGRIREYDTILKDHPQEFDDLKSYLKILGIPLLRVENNSKSKRYYLFSKIPFIKIKKKKNKTKCLLFGFIPLLKIAKKSTKNTFLLFNFIPLWSYSKKKINNSIKVDELYQKNKLKYIKNKSIKVYFLYHSDAFWPSWKSLWEECTKDVRIEAKMIYCPTKKQNAGYEGQFINSENFLKTQNIEYMNIKDWNIEQDKPHVLVIQTPYDIYHRIPSYYSEEFKRKGMRIIYISYGLEFTESQMSIENHFKLPIYKNAWKIYSFAKFLKGDYVKYGKICKNVIESIGHPKFDNLFFSNKNKEIDIIKKKANGKKIIVWHPHFPCNYSTLDGKNVCSTFSWNDNITLLNYIKNRKDIFCIFMPHHLFFGVFENLFGVSKNAIKEFQDIIKASKNIHLWNGDYAPILNIGDFFLGERSAVTMEMIVSNKPVIYLEQHPEQYNDFGKDVINSYYYAKTADDAIKYLETLFLGKDTKQKIRKSVFDKYIAEFFDGKSGYRIKENIISSLERD